MKRISLNEFIKLRKDNKDIKVVDVRTPAEFSSCHLDGSTNLSLGSKELESYITNNQSSPLYIMCQSGKRAEMACNTFSKQHQDLIIVEGGMNNCLNTDLPLNKGKGAISLERQVRIVAGALVLTGVILCHILNSNFIYLSAFVGAGLMFAGITDTCAMGILLTKMPWNKGNNTSCRV